MGNTFKRMYENRLEELDKEIMTALENNTKARNLIKEGKFHLIEALLLKSHDSLLIAANTIHAVKEYSQCLEVQGNQTKEDRV